MYIRDILTQRNLALTPSEAKIAQTLLADYPIGGLGTAASLAKRAGVSDPTVIRLITKLGFKGFPDFQAKLLEEVEAGLRSPLMMMETKRPTTTGRSVVETYIQSAARVVQTAAGMTLPQVYDRAAQLIMSARRRVLVVGGRFSRHVAGMLAGYLGQFRSDVISLSPLSPESFDLLLDIDERDALVVFDYRRYQTDVIRFAEQAARCGAKLVLFTDPWRSPVAQSAKVVIVGPVEISSPYDSLAPAVAQIEALVAHILAEESRERNMRVKELEQIRAANTVTLDNAPSAPRRAKRLTHR
jgi:DNA-binding MurR/RpiR family transcriptional regulator